MTEASELNLLKPKPPQVSEYIFLLFPQVHYLVRKNMMELDDLKREHEEIYRELQSCYGLEKCLKGLDIDLATSNWNLIEI